MLDLAKVRIASEAPFILGGGLRTVPGLCHSTVDLQIQIPRCICRPDFELLDDDK